MIKLAQYKDTPVQVDTEPAKIDTNQRRAVVKKEAHLGASKLAEQLGTSMRTIYRDAEVLGVTLNGAGKLK